LPITALSQDILLKLHVKLDPTGQRLVVDEASIVNQGQSAQTSTSEQQVPVSSSNE